MLDVENILNNDEFLADTIDTTKEGVLTEWERKHNRGC